MRIGAKGQVTIPIEVREQLGLFPDTEVEFEIDGDAARIVRVREARRGRRVIGRMRGRADNGMTTDEILALTRGDADDDGGPR
ncbi:MAG: AbrB/MazE/SpoVT family DNA-binding domain-containing protein [Acidimicrobiia bacterium]